MMKCCHGCNSNRLKFPLDGLQNRWMKSIGRNPFSSSNTQGKSSVPCCSRSRRWRSHAWRTFLETTIRPATASRAYWVVSRSDCFELIHRHRLRDLLLGGSRQPEFRLHFPLLLEDLQDLVHQLVFPEHLLRAIFEELYHTAFLDVVHMFLLQLLREDHIVNNHEGSVVQVVILLQFLNKDLKQLFRLFMFDDPLRFVGHLTTSLLPR